ncbi:YeeE/YedE thiosulfate transporter family protein [Desulfovibrio ferrophilus]|uniref:YeeE/YedE family protein n=1 Tax=Desulfovibrio ferrophilus TaxID=241368 RepID=A0A2Z6B171_9BACT|nr:YeeE/YedE thiosulfate transporter family protein [Desulfovibrio ferrophilus]BBD09146.1 YeeE/YedE family protein [Desulfovibrio ferrophilus]
MDKFTSPRPWNPYLCGGLSGLLVVLSVWIAGKYFGASTTFVRSAGLIEQLFDPERVAVMDYFIKTAPKIDWQWMFVAGIFIGSYLAAKFIGGFKIQAVPDMWQERFGPSTAKRALVAFIGGVIAIFGARLAGGCPSGHGLSGTLQLSLSGFIALVCFFLGGLLTARIIYGREGR